MSPGVGEPFRLYWVEFASANGQTRIKFKIEAKDAEDALEDGKRILTGMSLSTIMKWELYKIKVASRNEVTWHPR